MLEFKGFPKIPRLFREIIITEKLDGTNAGIHVDEDGTMTAASRNRWLTTDHDNYGFGKWVERNETELRELGPGMHWGEWWGNGIQRGYGLREKRFSLFNVHRWDRSNVPLCCEVVPILYQGEFSELVIQHEIASLRKNGSSAACGFMSPEGVVVYLNRSLFKYTIDGDGHKDAIRNQE